MVEINVRACPKNLLNGPCGGALNGKCEVDGRECPWVRITERLNAGELFEEHPLLLELENFVKGDSKPRTSAFWRNLERGRAFSVEFPIRAVKKREDVSSIIGRLEGDLVTVPDNPLGFPHYDPVALACYIKTFGREVMPHITAKDRNLTALTSELRTAQVFGCDAVLLTTGDWPGFALPSRPVFDVDSPNLIRLARLVFAGVLPTREVVEVEERPRVIGTMSPHYNLRVEAKRVMRKLIAGSEAFFTQVIASPKSVETLSKTLKEIKKYADVEPPVVASLLYPMREEMKPFLRSLGIPVGDEPFEALLEEIKSLEAVGGIDLIVSAGSLEEWISLWNEAREKIGEVMGW